ncbi:MAG TPA: hypothetical protein VFR15_07760 [Chloroflexia bacterium]|nr:hypothetical protein [Chloroflexia bacterium]
MTTRSDYTDDEWQLLHELPDAVATLVLMAGSSGPIGTIREMEALGQANSRAASRFSGVPLIQALARSLPPVHAGPRKERQGDTLDMCREAVALLDAKAAPEEASAYRKWIIAVAQEIAWAAKEGAFLGFGGERVSQWETEVMREVSSALGLPATPQTPQTPPA